MCVMDFFARTLVLVSLAILNEAMRAMLTFDMWLTLKVWGVTILSFVFTLANIPMLLRHGLDLGEEDETAKETSTES